MNDKLKELVAKWPHEYYDRKGRRHDALIPETGWVHADELCRRCLVETLLAEQAPAGEFDARDHEPRLFSPPDITLKDGEAIVAFLGCSCGWNSDGKAAEKELWSEHILRAAGRSSQLAKGALPAYDKTFGDERLCECGHPYRRHFDTYEKLRPIGCKYCPCVEWTQPAEPRDPAGKLGSRRSLEAD